MDNVKEFVFKLHAYYSRELCDSGNNQIHKIVTKDVEVIEPPVCNVKSIMCIHIKFVPQYLILCT